MNTDKQKRICREVVQEGIVLLKNENNVLPLRNRKIAVFGRAQIDTVRCGSGSASTLCDSDASLLGAFERGGLNLDRELAEKVREFCKNSVAAEKNVHDSCHSFAEMPVSMDEIKKVASRNADTALVIIARAAGENSDVKYISGDAVLSSDEMNLLKNVSEAFPHTVLILNCGNIPELSFLDKINIDSVIFLSLPGEEGGNGLCDILSGKCCPSGKLTDTIPMHLTDSPSASSFGGEGDGLMQEYREDIFVGYRYYNTFAKDKIRYPFGFGLSYTSFSVETVSFTDSDPVTIKCKVENTGKYAGKETVQVYYKGEGKLSRPDMSLCDFKKTPLLLPGESVCLEFSIPQNALASFDDTGVLGIDSWWLEKGSVTFYVGNSSLSVEEAGEIEFSDNVCIEKCTHIETELSVRKNRKWEDEALIHKSLFGDYATGEGTTVIENSKKEISVCFRFDGTYNIICEKSVTIDGYAYSPEDGKIVYSCVAGMKKLNIEDEKIIIERLNQTVEIQKDTIFECGHISDATQWIHINPVSVNGQIFRAATYFHAAEAFSFNIEAETTGFYELSFLYSNKFGKKPMCETMSVMISNIEQYFSEKEIEQTVSDGSNSKVFTWSSPEIVKIADKTSVMQVIALTHEAIDVAALRLKYIGQNAVIAEKKRKSISSCDGADKELDSSYLSLPEDEKLLSEMIKGLSDFDLARVTCGNEPGYIGGPMECKIPLVKWTDGPSGIRQSYATVSYPCGTLIGCTWNTELAEKTGAAVGEEAKALHIGIWLAPGLNIHRNLLCGRNFEYYSEDPLVSGKMAAAVVRGTQSVGVSAVPKHFLCNSTEYNRLRNDSLVSAKAIREIYLPAFKTVIKEGNPDCIMTSYNYVNGIKVPENPVFCVDILRKELGFKGVEITDWGNDSVHQKELLAGHDLKMSYGNPKAVEEALQSGMLSRERAEESALRILSLLAKAQKNN